MFTGIIEELGTVKGLDNTSPISKLQVLAPKIGEGTQVGQSICVNGVCLTCIEIKKDLISFELMPETLQYTNLERLKVGEKVNLERALKACGRIDGHIVTGHIDSTGIISKKQLKGSDVQMQIESPASFSRYIVLKGSVAVDGVSLTVAAQEANFFTVNLIPYTLKNTTLGIKKERDIVNIECDIMAKYIDRIISHNQQISSSNITSSFLKEHGFI